MSTCSGIQYHHQNLTSEKDSTFANITKLLEDLTARMSKVEQELESNRERETRENTSENGPRLENHTFRNTVQTDHDGTNLKNIKLETPTFDGQLDLQVFLDWTSDTDHYFDWYNMFDERRIRFAKMKLVGQG